MEIKDREIVLGVTGGIAAYKAADLASRLVQAGAKLTVVLTAAGEEFVQKTTFAALSTRPVYTSLWEPLEFPQGPHIGLARRGSLLVIAPASADFLAKGAHGLADDLLSTLLLTFTGPILYCPAMNSEMWRKPAVQRNIKQLIEDGARFVEPGSGWLSCGEVGPGRMAEPTEIVQKIQEIV